jgi:hypothetical protein
MTASSVAGGGAIDEAAAARVPAAEPSASPAVSHPGLPAPATPVRPQFRGLSVDDIDPFMAARR